MVQIHKRIQVNGVVQGVGFRPFVCKIALKNSLNGWVLNNSQGVLIEIQGSFRNYQQFKQQLLHNIPPMAHIVSYEETDGHFAEKYNNFSILNSADKQENNTLIPPDSNVCPECLAELLTNDNRRYRYPFINCTNCGPRYTLIQDMPRLAHFNRRFQQGTARSF